MATAHSLEDIRQAARRRLPRIAFDFFEGGAEDEVTLRANRAAFGRVVLRPRWLEDVTERSQRVSVAGQVLELPVLLAPAGMARLAHPRGEVAAARAAARHGTALVLTSNATMSIERVAEEAPGPHWFQIYLWRVRERNEEIVRRVEQAGYRALVVTIDVPVLGKRERDLRNGFAVPLRPRVAAALDIARRPRWARDVLLGERITFANYVDIGGTSRATELWRFVNSQLHYPGATYEDLAWLRERWRGPLLVKGVLTAEDAEQCLAIGVDGIIVSNHGGRQLDGVAATLDALPEVVAAVNGRADVLLDGGIRRGSDVIKALALGAQAVLIGRPYLYGLAVAGEAGVDRVLSILRDEIDRTLALLGRRSPAELDATCVTPATCVLHDPNG